MTPDTIDRNAEEVRMKAAKLREKFIVEHHLVPTHWAPVSRVEGEDCGRAAQFAQRDGLIRGRMQGEVRGWGAGPERLGRSGRFLVVFVATHITSSVLHRRGARVVTLTASNAH